MIKRFFMLLVGIGMIFSVSLANDTQIKLPDIYVEQSEVFYTDLSRVIGMMKIKNNTDAYFPEVYYKMGLVSSRKVGQNEDLYVNNMLGVNEPIKFSIGPKQEKEIYFIYDIPEYFPEYVTHLGVSFFTRTMELSNTNDLIKLSKMLSPSEKGFLLTSGDDLWEIDKKELRGDIGPEVTTSTKAYAKTNLVSTFDREITVIPKVTIYKRLDCYDSEPILVTNAKSVKFSPKEEKEVKINIPIISTPDSYFIKIEFVDEEGKVVSHEHSFRYVVKGINSKILETYLTEDERGLMLNIFVSGPADLDSELKDVVLSCRIENADEPNEALYDDEVKTNLHNTLKRKVISLDKFDGLINIVLKLYKNNETYDENTITINLDTLSSDGLQFPDIKDKKVKDAANILNLIGMISGYPDGSFKPNNNITRAEFTVIATRLAGLESTNSQPSVFNDVVEEHWAKDFINLAQANGCVSGYSDGTFRPDNNVTIAESITILLNVLEYRKEVLRTELTWPFNYLKVASNIGIVSDTEYIEYMNAASRGDVSIMTKNALFHKIKEGGEL